MKTTTKTFNFILFAGIALLLYYFPFASVRSREQAFENASHEFQRGDSNNNGVIDISDAIFTLNHLFLGNDRPSCLSAADSNDDGSLNISDAVFLLSFLFEGAGTPPYPDTGLDPTPDLGCREAPLHRFRRWLRGGPDLS